MKKTLFIIGAVTLLFSVSAQAQTDSIKAQTDTSVTEPMNPPTPVTTELPANTDRWNNYDPAKYQLLPMPQPLTTEKIFPVIGEYTVTDKAGATSNVTVTLDETNKGLVWIDGLPEGRVKALLRKSPSTYKIPEQKLGEEKDAKKISEGILIYDKDANLLNICMGCKYNNDNPDSVFVAHSAADETTAATEEGTTKKTTKAKAKTSKVKQVFYTGSKATAEETVLPDQTIEKPKEEPPVQQ